MKVYKTIERRAKIYGLSPVDLGLLLCTLLILFMLGNLLQMFLPIGGGYYLMILIFFVVGLIILRKSSAQRNPSFLLSYISYHFFQPKDIDHI